MLEEEDEDFEYDEEDGSLILKKRENLKMILFCLFLYGLEYFLMVVCIIAFTFVSPFVFDYSFLESEEAHGMIEVKKKNLKSLMAQNFGKLIR